MHITKFKPALALFALALLNACASTSVAPSIGGGLSSGVNGKASVVGNAKIGDTVELPAGNPTGASSADIIAEYFAASNRRCRQVLPRGGEGRVRLACKNSDGSWEWVRSLTNASIATPLPALASVGAAQPLVLVGEALPVEGSVQNPILVEASSFDATDESSVNNAFTVDFGESLWKFAQRTTGSGVNWQAIAELNDIDDARTIETGMTLLVPSVLVQGR